MAALSGTSSPSECATACQPSVASAGAVGFAFYRGGAAGAPPAAVAPAPAGALAPGTCFCKSAINEHGPVLQVSRQTPRLWAHARIGAAPPPRAPRAPRAVARALA